MPTFRAMQPRDLAQVVAIEHACVEFPWATAHFESSLRNGHNCQVMCVDNTIIAYAIVMLAALEASLLNICVDLAHRRQGHAEQLLTRMIETAKAQHAESMFLEVRESNHAARTLYEKTGFNDVGLRPNYYPAKHGREHAIIMALVL